MVMVRNKDFVLMIGHLAYLKILACISLMVLVHL